MRVHFRKPVWIGSQWIKLLGVTLLAICLIGTALHPSTADEINLDVIIEHVESTLVDDHVPGAAVAIVIDGKIVLARGFGKNGDGTTVTAQTAFRLGSISKAFTALTVMALVEAGTISLDQPAAELVPGFGTEAQKAWRTVTLRHLLTHTSGMPARTPSASPNASLAEHIAALADVRPETNPGEQYLYSSANYLVVAHVLEAVTGQSYASLLERTVLTPLGVQQKEPSTPGHQYWFLWPRTAESSPAPGRLATASQSASVRDMANFLLFQSGNGSWNGETILNSESMSVMHTGTAQGDGFRYGFGWRESEIAGVHAVHHGGILPNYRSKMVLLPELNAGVVVLTNVSSLLPFSIRPTSHRLADEIASYLAGGRLSTPHFSFRTWLLIYWSGLGLILLHQIVTLVRIFAGHDSAKRPAIAALTDAVIVAAILVALPVLIGLTWREIMVQTPDLALWLGAMSVFGLLAAALRFNRLRQ